MEPPGAIPPDRDKHSVVHQQPNINTPTAQQQHQQQQQQNSSVIGVSAAGQQGLERLSRPMAFDKMESLVREMQVRETGVPVRQQKTFLTSIPYAFMGYDLIEWLMDRLSIEESEALSIANQLCLHGYFFPVNDTKTLVVKDDSSLYRFQTPYYWPWQHKAPDNVEYAIYLVKRSLRNKQRHGLEDYETDALNSLNKNLKGKWDFITMQAEEQVRLAKERKKGDKIVGDSQERAYWRVHRPPPNCFTPLEPCPVPSRDRQGVKPKKRTVEDWQREVEYLQKSLGRTRMKMSQACESLTQYWETFAEYDFFLNQALPSNPWVSEDTTFWQLNNAIVDIPTEKRVKRWAISIEELVADPTGLQEFTTFLEKEYSHENIRFWIAVNRLRRSAHSQVAKKVNEIYEEFLKPGAPCEINIDGKTMEVVQKGLKNPSRFTFDAAAEHIYMLLLKKDCYPRFIRSDHYKSLLASGKQPAHKKRFFGFGGVAKKKSSTTSAPNPVLLTQTSAGGVPPPGNLSRRRGSDRSLTGSAHELAVISVKDVNNKVPHSHSQSNLSEIPYRDTCKSLSDRLESTAEGASAVCPWETPEPVETNVLLSVCPWEETESPKNVPKPRHGTALEISEVSERMRLSCGLRQNTLDSDFHSTKRLMPHVTEQRRASMTMAPRVSEFQFAVQRQAVTRAATTPSPTTGLPDEPPAAPTSAFGSLSKASSFETRDEANLMKSLTISEECSEPTESRDILPTTSHTTAANTQIVPFEDKSVDESRTINTSNIESSVNTRRKESVTLSLQIGNSSEKLAPASQGTTPIINVVCDIEDNPTERQTEGNSDSEIDVSQPIEEERAEVERANRPEIVRPRNQANIESRCTCDINILITESAKENPRGAISQISFEGRDEESTVHDELSPTTEEYQECAQFGDQSEDYDYDIESVDSNLAPGCVAPAPTPAPSLAPLAEIETDQVDDDQDPEPQPEAKPEPSEQATKPETGEVKKKRKKRDSDAKKLDDKTDASGQPKTSSEEANRNAVCPWEDEDVSASDATFVKTYATLGYL